MASVAVNATADGDNTLIAAPGAGLCIVVFGFVLTGATTAGQAILKSGAGGTTHARLSLGTSGGVGIDADERAPAFVCDANAALVVNCATGQDVLGMIVYGIRNA
jgi:hypothetical protein